MEVNGLEKLNNEITFDQLLYGQTFIVSDKESSYVAVYMKCVKSIGGKDTEYGVNIETGITHYFGSGTVVKPVVATLNVTGISDKCLVSHDDNVSHRYSYMVTFKYIKYVKISGTNICQDPEGYRIGRAYMPLPMEITSREDIENVDNILKKKFPDYDDILAISFTLLGETTDAD